MFVSKVWRGDGKHYLWLVLWLSASEVIPLAVGWWGVLVSVEMWQCGGNGGLSGDEAAGEVLGCQ